MKTFTGIDTLLASLKSAKGIARRLLCLALVVAFSSCGDSPRSCFESAVLNCNMIQDFASKGMEQRLESPSVKLTDAKTGAFAPMTRKQVVDDKIAFVEQSLAKVRQLKLTDDNREMAQASLALHEFVLSVYRNEYQGLAKLYDGGAPKGAIEQAASSIATKYGAQFRALSERLTAAGKTYAARHQIEVRWDIHTAPSP